MLWEPVLHYQGNPLVAHFYGASLHSLKITGQANMRLEVHALSGLPGHLTKNRPMEGPPPRNKSASIGGPSLPAPEPFTARRLGGCTGPPPAFPFSHLHSPLCLSLLPAQPHIVIYINDCRHCQTVVVVTANQLPHLCSLLQQPASPPHCSMLFRPPAAQCLVHLSDVNKPAAADYECNAADDECNAADYECNAADSNAMLLNQI